MTILTGTQQWSDSNHLWGNIGIVLIVVMLGLIALVFSGEGNWPAYSSAHHCKPVDVSSVDPGHHPGGYGKSAWKCDDEQIVWR
ncbi:hypothetical protein [Variovorax sp. OV329]|uniref:hypothetical protein n=1 Tax=Variovorax sp. OV329 TaxID=1882825 RepID=UPI0008E03575|nr:hypothetical protein [Variovorax sp. OV329]SFM04684.1 hypothetical protein SAMN05444747_102154 [Variovorax sp. OV329]